MMRGARKYGAWAAAAGNAASVLLGLVPAAALAAFIVFMLAAMSREASPRMYLDRLTIPESLLEARLGYVELGQRPGPDAAELSHVLLRKDPDNGWMISNIAKNRRLLLIYSNDRERLARQWRPEEGDVLLPKPDSASHIIEVTSASDERVTLKTEDGKVTIGADWRGRPKVVDSEGVESAPNCPDSGRIAIGGGVSCLEAGVIGAYVPSEDSDRAKDGGRIPDNAVNARLLGDWRSGVSPVLHLGAGDGAEGVFLRRAGASEAVPLRDLATPLVQGDLKVARIVVGRTHYRINATERGGLELRSVDRQHLFANLADDAPGTSAQGGCRPPPLSDTLRSKAASAKAGASGKSPEAHVPLAPSNGSSYAVGGEGSGLCNQWILEKRLGEQPGIRLWMLPCIALAILLHAWSVGAATGWPRLRLPAVLLAGAGAATFIFTDSSSSNLIPDRVAALGLGYFAMMLWAAAVLIKTRGASRILFSTFTTTLVGLLGVAVLCFAGLLAIYPDNGASRFLDTHIGGVALLSFVTAMAPWAYALVQLLWRRGRKGLDRTRHALVGREMVSPYGAISLSLIGVFLITAALQGFVGTEEGVFGVQPVELAKPIAVSLVAISAAKALHARDFAGGAFFLLRSVLGWIFIITVAIIFILAPALNLDFSPLLVLSLAFVLAWIPRYGMELLGLKGGMPAIARVWRVSRVMVRWSAVLFLIFALLPVWGGYVYSFLHMPGAHSVAEVLRKDAIADLAETPRRRFDAHREPSLYRDDSLQMRRSLELIANAPRGVPGYTEGAPLEVNMEGVARSMTTLRAYAEDEDKQPIYIDPARTPAGHDDFIGSVMMERVGLWVTALVIAAQIAMIAALIGAAVGAFQVRAQEDFRVRAARRVTGGMAVGAAALLFVQWLISWANVAGLSPIMGQPMTLISAGRSHLLAVGGFAMIAMAAACVTASRGGEGARLVRREDD